MNHMQTFQMKVPKERKWFHLEMECGDLGKSADK